MILVIEIIAQVVNLLIIEINKGLIAFVLMDIMMMVLYKCVNPAIILVQLVMEEIIIIVIIVREVIEM